MIYLGVLAATIAFIVGIERIMGDKIREHEKRCHDKLYD